MASSAPDHDAAPSAGTLGRYRITGTLGHGAMGVVYRALDPAIDRKIALKVLSFELPAETRANFRDRFLHEARAAGRLNHPNIVTIHDVGEHDGIPYIAMELLLGLTLREVLDSQEPPSVKRATEIAVYVARGLAYAHQKGVVHRDIKPANIMLTRSGTVKIMDFGIAHSPKAASGSSDVAGSPRYMSPEQCAGKPADPRSDIFALGIVLYEMLAGRPPYQALAPAEMLQRVSHDKLLPPSHFNAEVPPELDAIVLHALQRNPAKRLQQARELAEALGAERRVLGKARQPGAEIPPPPRPIGGDATLPAAVAASPRHAQRRWLVAGAVALALAAGIGLQRFGRNPAPAPAAADTLMPEPPGAVRPAVPPAANANANANANAAKDVATEPTPAVAVATVASIPEPPAPSPTKLAPPAEPLPAEAPPRPARNQTTRQPAAATGTLRLAIHPWGEIHVDGHRMGVSPPTTRLHLAAGEHRVEIRNLDFPPFEKTVTVRSGESVTLRHRFRP